MRLKKYLEFIKESIKEDVEEGKFWQLDKDDILEYLVDLVDSRYTIDIDFGFADTRNGNEVFSERIVVGETKPSYLITIRADENDTDSEDVTDSLIFAYDIIKNTLNADIEIHDSNKEYTEEELKNGTISIKEGPHHRSKDNKFYYMSGDYIQLFIKQGESIKITPKQLCEYYDWEYDYEDEDENIYCDYDTEDLSDNLIDIDSHYKPILDKGMEAIWDWYYDSSNYEPDTQSFFQYSLDKENEVLMIKAMIKEVGGLEELVHHIANETDEDLSGKSEEEVIDFLLKERYYHTLSQICSNSDICGEVKTVVADWEMGAHATENYDNIISAFDKIVDKHFNYTKVEKEVEKSYHITNSEGEREKKKYKESVIYYRIKFNEKWMDCTEDWSDRDMRDYVKNIRDLCDEWTSNEYLKQNFNPYLTDYGSVDTKEMNVDIKHQLEAYLKD